MTNLSSQFVLSLFFDDFHLMIFGFEHFHPFVRRREKKNVGILIDDLLAVFIALLFRFSQLETNEESPSGERESPLLTFRSNDAIFSCISSFFFWYCWRRCWRSLTFSFTPCRLKTTNHENEGERGMTTVDCPVHGDGHLREVYFDRLWSLRNRLVEGLSPRDRDSSPLKTTTTWKRSSNWYRTQFVITLLQAAVFVLQIIVFVLHFEEIFLKRSNLLKSRLRLLKEVEGEKRRVRRGFTPGERVKLRSSIDERLFNESFKSMTGGVEWVAEQSSRDSLQICVLRRFLITGVVCFGWASAESRHNLIFPLVPSTIYSLTILQACIDIQLIRIGLCRFDHV